MKRSYKSGAEKRKEKIRKEETSRSCSELISAWLNQPLTSTLPDNLNTEENESKNIFETN